MDTTLYTTNLKQFWDEVYQNFNNRADTFMELLDAMCSYPQANSVVEYSLAACFRRSYSTIFKAIDELDLAQMWLPQRLAPHLPRPKQWPFWLLLADVTPQPRQYAHTLADRSMVYAPEVVKGKLPVTIGHQYSTVAMGLEPEAGVSSSWVLPLLTRRVGTDEDKEMVGAEQIASLMEDKTLPFRHRLTVEAVDSSYSKPALTCTPTASFPTWSPSPGSRATGASIGPMCRQRKRQGMEAPAIRPGMVSVFPCPTRKVGESQTKAGVTGKRVGEASATRW